MKYSIPLVAVLCLGLLVGCKSTTPPMTKALVKSAVQVGVTVGVSQAPEAVQYLRYAAPVICEAARGTNIQPEFVVSQLQNNAQANQFKNPKAILIFNSAFGIYVGLYEAYGAEEVANRPHLTAFLEATCEGILAGLPSVTTNGLPRSFTAIKKLPPHIR